MTKGSIARRYAKALFNLLEPASLESARTGLFALSTAWAESPALKHVLASPVFTLEEKTAVLTTCSERAGCPPRVKSFLGQVLKKNRVSLLPDIAQALQELTDQQLGKQQVSLVSAKTLDPAAQRELQARMQSCLDREVEMTFQTDPSLLSGLQVQIGSKVYDSTVRGRLEKIRALLVKG